MVTIDARVDGMKLMAQTTLKGYAVVDAVRMSPGMEQAAQQILNNPRGDIAREHVHRALAEQTHALQELQWPPTEQVDAEKRLLADFERFLTQPIREVQRDVGRVEQRLYIELTNHDAARQAAAAMANGIMREPDRTDDVFENYLGVIQTLLREVGELRRRVTGLYAAFVDPHGSLDEMSSKLDHMRLVLKRLEDTVHHVTLLRSAANREVMLRKLHASLLEHVNPLYGLDGLFPGTIIVGPPHMWGCSKPENARSAIETIIRMIRTHVRMDDRTITIVAQTRESHKTVFDIMLSSSVDELMNFDADIRWALEQRMIAGAIEELASHVGENLEVSYELLDAGAVGVRCVVHADSLDDVRHDLAHFESEDLIEDAPVLRSYPATFNMPALTDNTFVAGSFAFTKSAVALSWNPGSVPI